jgi:hypothetical protein
MSNKVDSPLLEPNEINIEYVNNSYLFALDEK